MQEIVVGIVVGIIIIAIIVIVSVNKAIFKKYDRLVKETSLPYRYLLEINKKFNFNSLYRQYDFKTYLKSKRGLENFSLENYLMTVVAENETTFITRLEKAKQNLSTWKVYEKEYKKIKVFTTPETIKKLNADLNLKLKPQVYNKHEARIFEATKLYQPTTQIFIYCHASYTSPAGNSYYEKKYVFFPDQVARCLQQIKFKREEAQRIEKEKLARKATVKTKEERLREKEKELKAKEKKYVNIEQREQELEAKEKEFAKATEGHIYAAADENEEEDMSNLSPYEQLKKLKKMLNDGDITYEEYNKRRKEIAG